MDSSMVSTTPPQVKALTRSIFSFSAGATLPPASAKTLSDLLPVM
ncbi:hypothetical protein Patl1_11006 [Pistacia atlantica]|uniref:Uncharacterized protein n=1 Tax=Pistacia atlantica TaxID=434234 RepID=A0ACC1A5F4_9ROSI|nr:hypothetical protein Patl1_11006 [Pistacia atlantica]